MDIDEEFLRLSESIQQWHHTELSKLHYKLKDAHDLEIDALSDARLKALEMLKEVDETECGIEVWDAVCNAIWTLE